MTPFRRRRTIAAVFLCILTSCATGAGPTRGAPNGTQHPIIDMHVHAFPADFFGPPPQRICAPVERFVATDARHPIRFDAEGPNAVFHCASPLISAATADELRSRTLAAMRRAGVVVAVTSGPLVDRWRAEDPQRIVPALRVLTSMPPIEEIRAQASRGELAVLAEMVSQYLGMAPDDPALEPYFALAEELDLPVGIHMGPGAPGAGYVFKYRAELSDPFRLEAVLLRHPRLRAYVMHAGWPLADAMIHMLFSFPQLYVDISLIDFLIPREEFHAYLRRLVEAGMVDRIMFGSDQALWPELVEIGIDHIRSAEFLSEQQKQDILYGNAARFLRLTEEQTRRHRELAAEQR